MRINGANSEEYIIARSVLLDALEALGELKESVVLIGAQAIYAHAGSADLATSIHTKDADFVVDPSRLPKNKSIAQKMLGSGFSQSITANGTAVGTWCIERKVGNIPTRIPVDFLVPTSLGGGGNRSAHA